MNENLHNSCTITILYGGVVGSCLRTVVIVVAVMICTGHERLRPQFLETYAGSARAVIFVVDSSTITKEIKDVAE